MTDSVGPMFMQIAGTALNLDRITYIVGLFEESEKVIVYFEERQNFLMFSGESKEVFLHWWNNYAKVYRLP